MKLFRFAKFQISKQVSHSLLQSTRNFRRSSSSSILVSMSDSDENPLAKHYRLAGIEGGPACPQGIPIWTTNPSAVEYVFGENTRAPASEIEPIPRLESFSTTDERANNFFKGCNPRLIKGLLSKEECERIIELSEATGYTEEAPVSLGKGIRDNEGTTWVAGEDLNDALFQRARPMLPQKRDERSEQGTGDLCGLNARWRFYKYKPNDVFRPHTDNDWPWTKMSADGKGVVRDAYDHKRRSQFTIVWYLNDDFVGGATRIYAPINLQGGYATQQDRDNVLDQAIGWCNERLIPACDCEASQGDALIFYHGRHPYSPVHEGCLVTSGTKYIIRTDVMYTFDDPSKALTNRFEQ